MAIDSTGIGEGIGSIASGLLGVALIALILNKSDNASKLISTSGSTFNTLLNTVELTGNSGSGRG
jgi:hypothetical protein